MGNIEISQPDFFTFHSQISLLVMYTEGYLSTLGTEILVLRCHFILTFHFCVIVVEKKKTKSFYAAKIVSFVKTNTDYTEWTDWVRQPRKIDGCKALWQYNLSHHKCEKICFFSLITSLLLFLCVGKSHKKLEKPYAFLGVQTYPQDARQK